MKPVLGFKKVIVKCDDRDLVEYLSKRFRGLTGNTVKTEYPGYKKLCEDVVQLAMKKTVTFEYVKGHDLNQYNIIADALASKARIKCLMRTPNFHISNYSTPNGSVRFDPINPYN